MSSSGRSTSSKPPVSSRPAPAASLPRRSSVTKMVNDVQDYFARGPIIGKTRSADILEQTEELSFSYRKQENETYEKVEALDEGIEGQCFVMKAATSGKLFVVKRTKPVKIQHFWEWQYPDSRTYKFPNEARTLGMTLKANRNLVQMLEIVGDKTSPGRYFLWMEYCSGGDLYNQVTYWWDRRRSPVPEQFLLHVFVSVADGLAFAHHGLRSRGDGKYTEDEFHQGVIHGDLKMENLFLRWTDTPLGGMPEVVMGDWGVAKRNTRKMVRLNPGTPAYHAPEDVAIHKNAPITEENQDIWLKVVNRRTTAMDMYALGQVTYQLAARERDPREIGKDPSDLTISREYDAPGLVKAIQKCLIVDKNERAEASFTEGLGLLPAINQFRTYRNSLVKRRMPLDPLEWARPK